MKELLVGLTLLVSIPSFADCWKATGSGSDIGVASSVSKSTVIANAKNNAINNAKNECRLDGGKPIGNGGASITNGSFFRRCTTINAHYYNCVAEGQVRCCAKY